MSERVLKDVVIYNYGKVTVYNDVTPEKSYHIIDGYSTKIKNGHLITPKDKFVLCSLSCKQYVINFHDSKNIFAVVCDDGKDVIKRFN